MGVNDRGWRTYVYSPMQPELARIANWADQVRKRDGDAAVHHPAVKLHTAVTKLMLQLIPANPGAPEFRQGNTLGKENRQWFRAKFNARYRLFYRYSTQHRAIVYAWISNEDTLRKAGSKTDPYSIFEAMLKSGDPPSDFDELLRRSRPLA